DFEDDDDDDDSEVDVEKDARKLQKKYGVATIVQTYQATTSTDILLNNNKTKRNTNSSVLNAPYLGSLSRSANQVLSLPPMSLAGETLFSNNDGNNNNNEEPPETIITNYGSLRDSHERGRFLDGPSSYREPTSGRIRQLDHRLRYHGTRSSSSQINNNMSIGERMQQSRKLKEIRQKEEQAKQQQQEGGTTTGDNNDSGVAADGGAASKKPAAKTSSLSAIMNEVSQRKSSVGDEAAMDETVSSSFREGGIMLPITKMDDDDDYETPTFRDNDKQFTNNAAEAMMNAAPSTSMLSTSLTAFEMLKMSNAVASSARIVSTTTNNASAASATLLQAPQSGVLASDDHHKRLFQPLARSMSDPTPHMHQLSLGDTHTTTTRQDVTTPAANAAVAAAVYGSGLHHPQHPPQQQQPQQQFGILPQQRYPLVEGSAGTALNAAAFGYSTAATAPLSTNGAAAAVDHDPDTDGAFGDMDME
ncbi:MAG: hypothetical protein SGARI_003246, partial [Bacillariaceae sp.]